MNDMGHIRTEKLIEAQKKLASDVIWSDDFSQLKTIAGVDQAFIGDQVISGVVVLDYESLETIEEQYSVSQVNFPYIPGLLSFREGPAIISAFKQIEHKPDMLMVDGCGVNHPRLVGLASHVGVELNISSIGVAKKILCGEYGRGVTVPGEYDKIIFNGKHVGWILMSKKRCNPIIVAPGHRVSVETSLEVVQHCLRGYKLPEPTRQAHNYVNRVKRGLLGV